MCCDVQAAPKSEVYELNNDISLYRILTLKIHFSLYKAENRKCMKGEPSTIQNILIQRKCIIMGLYEVLHFLQIKIPEWEIVG